MRAAADAGLDVLAITDHDTADGWAEAEQAARAKPASKLVPRHGDQHAARRPRGAPARLPARTRRTRRSMPSSTRILDGRSSRLPAMLEQLRGIGIDIEEADVHRAPRPVRQATGRPHVADALVALGVVREPPPTPSPASSTPDDRRTPGATPPALETHDR